MEYDSDTIILVMLNLKQNIRVATDVFCHSYLKNCDLTEYFKLLFHDIYVVVCDFFLFCNVTLLSQVRVQAGAF